MIPPPLPDELLAALPPAVLTYIRALETVAARLAARLAELEARLGQNSANSSKPPSSDGPHVKTGPAQDALRQGQGRTTWAPPERPPPPAPTAATNSPATTPTPSSTRSSNSRPSART